MPAQDILNNEVVVPVWDRLGECNVFFTAEKPTTEDRAAYSKGRTKFKGGKPVIREYENNLFFGAKKVKGIKAPERNGEGEWDNGVLFGETPLSSNSKDADHYRSDWKTIVAKHRPDLLAEVGNQLFNSSVSIGEVKDEKEKTLKDLGIDVDSESQDQEAEKEAPLSSEEKPSVET